MAIAHIDFETRSPVDLRTRGLDNYVRDPDTAVWCMAYAFDDGPVALWTPEDNKRGWHGRLIEHVRDGGLVYGHNVAFEWAVWNHILAPRYHFPPLSIRQCRCTMAMAYAMSLPGSLGQAALAVGLEQEKDMDGHRLMMQMARPRRFDLDGAIVWWDDETRREKLYAYCRQDVETERALHKRLRELGATEQETWFLDHGINQRGIPVDMASVEKAIGTIEAEKARLDNDLKHVTQGEVWAASAVQQLTAWIAEQGVELPSIAKADVAKALKREDLPPRVRQALELRREAAKSSTAKLTAIQNVAGPDGRVRNTLQYHAAGTGRWGGRTLQPQNLPRPGMGHADIEAALEVIDQPRLLDALFGTPFDVVSWAIRAMICAPEGREFTTADYAAIEARVLPWLAEWEPALDEFRAFDAGQGEEPYCLMASDIYAREISKKTDPNERQVGKVTILQLGYEGGVGAWVTAAAGYGIDLEAVAGAVLPTATSEEKENATASAELYFQKNPAMRKELSVSAAMACDIIKQRFRAKHAGIARFWPALNQAAISAVKSPRKPFRAGRITFIKDGSFLWAVLPSKRALCYPYPKIVRTMTPWGAEKEALQYKGVNSLTKKWTVIFTYGGKLAENVTQAVARDVLRDALLRVDKAGMEIVMHVHDEIVVESAIGKVDLAEFEQLMAQVPVWAKGLPIAVEGWQGRRYRK